MPAPLNKEEFSKLVLPFMGDMARVAKHLCRNDFDSDDLVSETILKAFEKFNGLQQATSVKSWLLRIMHNTFVDGLRRRKIISADFTEVYSNDDEFSLYAEIISQQVSSDDPEAQFLNSILSKDIEKAIASLSDDFRAAVILNDIEQIPYKEIASILQIPVGTVRSRISRGKKLLQKFLFTHAVESGIISPNTASNEKICTCGENGELTPAPSRHKSSIKP
jgi:RNA polymerase sigma-70 factor, ECF subfamily